MIQSLRKDIYLIMHKKIFMMMLIGLTMLFSYISLNDITDVFSKGYSYQHHFIIGADYVKTAFKNGLFYLIPLIVVFPFADTWLNEKNMTDVLFTRVDKRKYFVSKYMVSFISGFLLLFIPLLISFLAEAVMLDFHTHELTMLSYFTSENNYIDLNQWVTFFELYLNHPYVYMLLFFLIISTFGGLCAMLAFSISLVCRQKVFTYISGFVLSIISAIVASFFNDPYGKWFFQALISPNNSYGEVTPVVYLMFLVFFLVLIFGLFTIYVRRDPLE